MTRLAQGRAMRRLPALLRRLEMMLRDQMRRNFALAEVASDPVGVLMSRKIMFGSAGRHGSKIVGEADVQNPPRSSTSALNARSASSHERIGRSSAFARG